MVCNQSLLGGIYVLSQFVLSVTVLASQAVSLVCYECLKQTWVFNRWRYYTVDVGLLIRRLLNVWPSEPGFVDVVHMRSFIISEVLH